MNRRLKWCKRFFNYIGSLTTPPCSENVNWFVMATLIKVFGKQVTRFADLIGENARPLQVRNWREMRVSY